MRNFILLGMVFAAGVASISNVCAETPDESKTKLKVKVAMALAAAKDKESCGSCRTDEDGCRADAFKQNKLLVLFVGGCYGRGELVVGTGAIACRADDYTGDKGDKGKPRIVLLVPKTDNTFEFGAILPATATDDEIKKAIEAASPKKKISVDWYAPDADEQPKDVAADAKPAAVAPPIVTATDGTPLVKSGAYYVPYYKTQAACPNCR